MKRFFFILSFSLTTLISLSQTTFIKVFSDVDATKPLSGKHIVETNDHNFSFLCSNGLLPVVIRLDESGNEFNRFSIQQLSLEPVCLAINNQYNYFYVGQSVLALVHTGYIQKTDSVGNILHYFEYYGAAGRTTGFGVFKTPENGMLYQFWFNDEMCNNPTRFSKIDSIGNSLWYYESSFNIGNSLKQSFQFLGSDRICTVAPQIINCYDSNLIYESNLKIFDQGVSTLVKNYYELYIIVDTTYGGGYVLASNDQISKADSSGNIIWTHQLPFYMSDQLALRQLQDSAFILVGDGVVSGAGRQLLIYKYDWNGNLIWSQNYGGIDDETFSNLLLTNDNGFLISGTTNSYGTFSKAIIIKADSMGNAGSLPLISASSNSICSGDSTSLTLPAGYTYVWNTGETTQAIYASSSNYYSAILTDTGGTQFFSDTISLNVLSTVKPNLGADTILCVGENLILNAGSGYSAYLWSTGSFNTTDTIDVGGNYIVETIDSNTCSTFDTIQVSFVSLPPFDLGPDVFQCDTTPVVLHSPGILSWLWSDGSTDSTLVVDSSGVYSLTLTNGVCFGIDYVNINIYPKAVVNLIEDSTACLNQIILLDAGVGFTSYLWQDGSSAQFYSAFSLTPATIQYVVSVIDSNGCPATDDVVIDFQVCISTNDQSLENEIRIFPNPITSSNSVLIDSKTVGNVSVEIISVTGNVLVQISSQTFPVLISTTEIPAGIYFVRIRNEKTGGVSNTKLVVQ